MTEFGFTLGMALLAAACAALAARWFARAEPPSRALREIADTVRIATASFTRIHLRFLLVGVSLVAFVLLVAFGVARPHSPADAASSAIESALWVAGSFCLGAMSVLGVLHVGSASSHTGALRLAAATRSNVAQLVTTAVRTAAWSGVLSVALPLVSFVLIAFVAWYRFAGLGSGAVATATETLKLPWLFAGFALGASLAALAARLLGGIFSSATTASAAPASDALPRLSADHPKHPAWLARMVAAAMDHAAGTCTDVAASTAAVCVVSAILGAVVFKGTGARIGGPVGIVMFCPLLLAFGLFASISGVVVVRADLKEAAVRSFDRGLAVTLVLSLAGQLACARWIFDAHWAWISVAAAAGLAAAATSLAASRLDATLSGAALQALLSASAAGGGALTLAALARSTVRAIGMLAAASAPLALAYYAGLRSGLPGGGAYGIAIATASMLSIAAYTTAVHGVAAQATCAAGMTASLTGMGPESAERQGRLADLAWWARRGSSGVTQASLLGLALAAIAALGPGALLGAKQAASAGPGGGETAVAIGLAVAALGVFVGRALASVGRATEGAAQDIRAHISSGVSTIDGNLVFAESYDPEHQSCLGMLLHGSARQAIPLELMVLGYALGLEIGMQLLTVRWGLLYAAEFSGVALAAAATVGLGWALALDGAATAWAALGKAIAGKSKLAVDEATKRSNNLPHGAAIVSDTVGGPLESMAAPSLQALVRLLVTVTLVLAPLFY
jgi:K(+)-stimulated pyrophosphate-energized sodium pump